jgi:hypothetical protein
MPKMPGPKQLAVRMLLEIFEDVRLGKVPCQVSSFSELHYYVDANEYGGFSPSNDAEVETMNHAQLLADAWLRERRPR